MLQMAREYNERVFVPPLSDAEVVSKVEHVIASYAKGRSQKLNANLLKRLEERRVSAATLNDKDLSRLFAELYADQLRYEPGAATFLYYNGRYWERDSGGLFSELLCKQFVDLLLEYRWHIPESDREAYRKAAEKYRGRAARERLLKDTRTELRVDSSQLDSDLNLLNMANCTVDLKTFEAHPHRASDMLTKCAPVEYAPGTPCALWESVLAFAFEGDADTMRYFQKAIGMAILGDTTKALFHVAGFTPRSGKSVALGVLVSLLGLGGSGYACVVPGNTFEQSRKPHSSAAREDLMLLRGARLAVVHESSQGMLLDAALVKQITGGDPLSARANYKGFETFTPCCNIFFVTNYMLQVTDRTVFASGRLRIVPFNKAVPTPQQDATLRGRLSEPENLSGILNWAIEGVRLYREEGLDMPERVASAIRLVECRTDYVAQFIENELVEVAKPENSLSQVHKEYRKWCEAKSVPALEKNDFLIELEGHGIPIGGRTSSLREPVLGYALKRGNSLNP